MKKLNKNISGIKVDVILGVNFTGKKQTLSEEEHLVGSRAHPFKVVKNKKASKMLALVLSSGDRT